MIPSWYAVQFHLGPIPVNVWGLFVAAGFLVGTWFAARWAPRYGFVAKDVVDFAVWAIVAGMLGARIGHVVFYDPAYYLVHPWDMLRIWEGGLSSFGGFAGAVIAAIGFVRKRQLHFLRFADTLSVPLALGWFIGRLGCYSIHDHPGIPCTGFLCVPFPDGTRRLDMGLLDGLLALAIVVGVLLWRRGGFYTRPFGRQGVKPCPTGMTTTVIIGAYGIGRFFLDFLRVGDARYAGLTPAQFGSIAFVVGACVIALKVWNHRSSSTS